jgi:hypothetical protein
LGVYVPIWEVRENNSAASSCAQPVLEKRDSTIMVLLS